MGLLENFCDHFNANDARFFVLLTSRAKLAGVRTDDMFKALGLLFLEAEETRAAAYDILCGSQKGLVLKTMNLTVQPNGEIWASIREIALLGNLLNEKAEQ